jgi:AcrR family transcriptional regulator
MAPLRGAPVARKPQVMSDNPRLSPKSARTRSRILDAAMGLFAARGYHAATNADIAEAAELTRGAMLYHFPTRDDLAAAAVAHIQAARTALFEAIGGRPDHGDTADHAIDTYWALLHEVPFKAFNALEAAARSDQGLRALLAPAIEAFDRAQMGVITPGLVQAGSSPRLQASRDLARFALEGLAQAKLTYDGEARTARLIAVIKRATHMLNRRGAAQDIWED